MFTYSTKVKLDLKGLREEVIKLKACYDEIGNRDSHEGRSRFSAYNNIQHFLKRVDNGSDSIVIDVEGSATGSSSRVYYKPSITSLAKPIRKYIIPVHEGNKFIFFDLKAAEFFMNCVFCQEQEPIKEYQSGNDIYLAYGHLFPEGTPRKVIKECLIANMYGVTPYTVAKRCGVTEAYAERMLRTVQQALLNMEMAKIKRIGYARRNNAYYAPRGFNQNDLVKIADVDPKKGFQPNLALSAYVQSALGLWMQALISKLQPLCTGTLLSVFDSLLIEFRPENEERIKEWLTVNMSPFITDRFGIGTTFYDAQEG